MTSDIFRASEYIPRFLKIKTKDNKIAPLIFNQSQLKLLETVRNEHNKGKPIRIIILKARQMGFSTAVEALIFHSTVTRENVNSQITAHTGQSTANLFKMSKLFFDELPEELKPMLKSSNARELIFENPTGDSEKKKKTPGLRSKIKCTTAGGSGIGRSDTLTNVHISEYAFWTGDKRGTLSGLLQAVPNLPGTMVIIESTANGYDDFKSLWDSAVRGENDFVPLFFPWFNMDEYRAAPPDSFKPNREEKRLKKAYGLDDEQLWWRRWCIKNNCGGDVKKFKQEYPSCPEEAFISTGDCVFDKEKLALRIPELRPPVKEGYFDYTYDGLKISDIRFVNQADGPIKIYKEVKKGYPYVCGGDTAGEGSDAFVGQVLDNTTGSQVAVLRHRYDDDMYARQMYCLGLYYNTALIAIEANFTTHPIRELERLKYPKQYVRESVDDFTHGMKKSYGFLTTSRTRPLLVAKLVEAVRDCPKGINDRETVSEMMTFVYDENRKPCAAAGSHDDLVMALGIAHFIRDKQSYLPVKEQTAKAKWTKDMYEDYRAASPSDKKYLIQKWGNPF